MNGHAWSGANRQPLRQWRESARTHNRPPATYTAENAPAANDARSMSPRCRAICLEVCEAYRMPLAWVLSASRFDPVCRARWACWAALYDLRRLNGKPFFSTTAIGRMFGMDHSTVVYGLKRHAKLTAEAVKEAA